MIPPTLCSTSDYIDAILAGNATHIRISFSPSLVQLTDDDISASGGVRINTILNSDDDLVMGKAVSTEIVLNVLNKGQFASNFNWKGQTITVEVGVEVSGVTQYAVLGTFRATKPERLARAEVIEIVLHDNMTKFDILADDFIDSLTFPITLGGIFRDLCTYMFVNKEIGDENSEVMAAEYASNPFTHGVTCRQILGWIAECNCCYAKFDYANKVHLFWYKDHTSSYSLDADHYYGVDISETATPTSINVIRCNSAEDENARYMYPVGSSGVEYTIVDNPLLLNMTATKRNKAMQNMYTRLNNLTGYVPMSVDAIGNPLIETGDIIEVLYDNNQSAYMPIFTRSFYWNGGCGDVYECTGNAERVDVPDSDKNKYLTGGQMAKKYTVQSGIDITDEGIQVSGGKFVKIISGGTLDVQSTNFQINSTDKYMQAGSWKFDEHGMSGLDSVNNYLFEVGNESGRTANAIIRLEKSDTENLGSYTYLSGMQFTVKDAVNNKEAKLAYNFMYNTVQGTRYYVTCLLPDTDVDTPSYIGWADKPWNYLMAESAFLRSLTVGGHDNIQQNGTVYVRDSSRNVKVHISTADDWAKFNMPLYADNYYGDGVYNGLDQTAAGYVLDARQGKALNDNTWHKEAAIYVSGVDANNYTTPGFYHVGISTNSPYGSNTFYGVLVVYSGGTGHLQQIAIAGHTTNHNVYVRGRNTSSDSWSSWKRLAIDDEVNTKKTTKLTDLNITSDTSILSLDNGFYQVSSSVDITPYVPYNYGTLAVMASANNYGMYLFANSVGEYFVRHRQNGSQWHTGWIQISKTSNTPTVVKGGIVETDHSFSYRPSEVLSVIIGQYSSNSILYSIFKASDTNAVASAIKSQTGISVNSANGVITVSNTTGNSWRYRVIALPFS